jgi:UDPglucose 6-dehydrogenase
MNIGVIGCGFVGATVADFLEDHLVNVWRIDPKLYPETDIFDLREKLEAFIVCVPTPQGKDGVCDDSIIKTVINQLDTDKPILLKSTVTPDLMQSYPSNITYNPEFLRARSAKEDFKKQEVFILGTDDEQQFTFWSNLFSHLNTNVIQTNRTTASMIKYTHNAWLATKVAFFHELFENAPQDMNYSTLTSTLGQMKNIGSSHMIAPSFEGTLGYGGHCFPKDVKALTNMLEHSILEQVIKTNETLNKRIIR